MCYYPTSSTRNGSGHVHEHLDASLTEVFCEERGSQQHHIRQRSLLPLGEEILRDAVLPGINDITLASTMAIKGIAKTITPYAPWQ